MEEGESSFGAAKETIGKGFDVDRGCGQIDRGRGRGGKFEIIFFICGMIGHKAWECPNKDGRKPEGKTHIVEVKLDNEVIVL